MLGGLPSVNQRWAGSCLLACLLFCVFVWWGVQCLRCFVFVSLLFLFLFFCLLVRLFVYLFVYLFVCLFVWLFVWLFICLSVCLFGCLFVYCLLGCLFVWLLACLTDSLNHFFKLLLFLSFADQKLTSFEDNHHSSRLISSISILFVCLLLFVRWVCWGVCLFVCLFVCSCNKTTKHQYTMNCS